MSHHLTETTSSAAAERERPSATAPSAALAALVAAPVLVLVASLTQASPNAHDTASELASIAAAPGRYQVSGAIGWCAMVLYVPALIALARPLWRSRRRLAGIGLGMSMTGLVALISLMGSGPVSLAMAQAPERAAMIRVVDAYESAPLTVVWMLVMVLGFSLGPVLLGFGLWRSGFPLAVPVLLLLGLIVQMLDAGRWPLALGYALTAAGMTLVAVVTVRRRSLVQA